MITLPSTYAIGDEVRFDHPMTGEPEGGIIVAITFTKAKVFYDIVDDYYGQVEERVDSCNVRALSDPINSIEK